MQQPSPQTLKPTLSGSSSPRPANDALYIMRDYQFDLVLLNQRLPDMDGAMLISRMRAAKHDTPIIALSAGPQARLKGAVRRRRRCGRPRHRPRRANCPASAAGSCAAVVAYSQLLAACGRSDPQRRSARRHRPWCARAAHGHGVRNPRTAGVAPEHDHDQGGHLGPAVWRHGRARDQDHRRVRLPRSATSSAKAGLPNVISTVWGRGYTVKDVTPDTHRSVPQPKPQPAPREYAFA